MSAGPIVAAVAALALLAPATHNHPVQLDEQSGGVSSIDVDTFKIDDPASGVLLADYRLKVTLYRTPGSHRQPRVFEVGAMSSALPDRFSVPASAGHIAWGRELAVPRYS